MLLAKAIPQGAQAGLGGRWVGGGLRSLNDPAAFSKRTSRKCDWPCRAGSEESTYRWCFGRVCPETLGPLWHNHATMLEPMPTDDCCCTLPTHGPRESHPCWVCARLQRSLTRCPQSQDPREPLQTTIVAAISSTPTSPPACTDPARQVLAGVSLPASVPGPHIPCDLRPCVSAVKPAYLAFMDIWFFPGNPTSESHLISASQGKGTSVPPHSLF